MSGLDRYRIDAELGRGAMGVVHLAYDCTLEREVALKELLFPSGLTPNIQGEMLERFQREARAAARLSHANVVQVFDVFSAGDRHFIAMELLDGESLGDFLAHSTLSRDAAVNVLIQVLDALQAAHSAGIVHRDIKPDNVFLLTDGRVKVADFGIARIVDAAAGRSTQIGTVLGTPGYMSPEQVMGLTADGRSDIFSAGVLGYEMLSGDNPFMAPSSAAILYRIANERVASLEGSGVPPAVAAIIDRALAKQPEQRYPEARLMAEDLRRGSLGAMHGERQSGMPTTESDGKKSTAPVLAVAAVGIVIVVGVFIAATTNPPKTSAVAPIASTETSAVIEPELVQVPPEEPSPVETKADEPDLTTPFWGAFCGGVSSTKSVSEKHANKVEADGYPALVLNLADYDSIGAPGDDRWVVCAGPYDTKSEAEAVSGELTDLGYGTAYAKKVK